MKTTFEDLKAAQALPKEKAPATPAYTLAKIGMSLTDVINRPGLDPAVAGELTVILDAVITTEVATRKDHETAAAASEALREAETTLSALTDYLTMEDRTPEDLFEVCRLIAGHLQGVLPTFRPGAGNHDDGEPLIEEGEPLPPDNDTFESDREYAPDPCDAPDHDDWYGYLVSRIDACDAPNDDDDWDGYSVVGIDASGVRIWG